MASPPITEHRPSEAQEDADRMSRSSLMMAWWAVLSAIFYLVVAAAMARSYGTANALIGIVMSILVYSAINAVLSRFAQRTGLTVAEFSRTLFGRLGALVATPDLLCHGAVLRRLRGLRDGPGAEPPGVAGRWR